MSRGRAEAAAATAGATADAGKAAAPAALALLACVAACAGRAGGAEPAAAAGNSFEWAGLRLDVRLVSAPRDRIRARATLTNVEAGPVTREVPFCVAMLRVYRGGERIWSDGARSGCFGIRIVTLESGESRTFHRSLRARHVLGDSLPAGRYRIAAFWPPASRPGPIRTEIEVVLGDVRLDPG